MADIFYTVLIIWVVWRIFGGSARKTFFHNNAQNPTKRNEGDVTVTTASKPAGEKKTDGGEYVDYEEIK